MCGRTGPAAASVPSHQVEGCRSSHSSSQRKKEGILAPRRSSLPSFPPFSSQCVSVWSKVGLSVGSLKET